MLLRNFLFLSFLAIASPIFSQNLVTNGHFPNGLMGWEQISSPQTSPIEGCLEAGSAHFWGNQVVGEGIRQEINFEKGKSYQITFCGIFLDFVLPNSRFRFRATNGANVVGSSPPNYFNCGSPNCEEMFLSPIQTLSWETYTSAVWTASEDYDNLVITMWNNENVDDGAKVSWARIDDIKIEEVQVCQAAFEFQTDDCGTVSFTNNSTGNTPSFVWDFGDGSGSDLATPNHFYTQGGNYDVCLTVNDGSCSNQICQVVNVTIDNTDPVIVCEDLNAVATDPFGVAVDFDLDAFDNCDLQGITYSLPSGSVFSCGTTTVRAVATDAVGNVSQCDFELTVECDDFYHYGLLHQVVGDLLFKVDALTNVIVLDTFEHSGGFDIELGEALGHSINWSLPNPENLEAGEYVELGYYGSVDGQSNSHISDTKYMVEEMPSGKYYRVSTSDASSSYKVTVYDENRNMLYQGDANGDLLYRLSSIGGDLDFEVETNGGTHNVSKSNDDDIIFLPPDGGDQIPLSKRTEVEVIKANAPIEIDYIQRCTLRFDGLGGTEIKEEKIIMFEDDIPFLIKGGNGIHHAKSQGYELKVTNLGSSGEDGLIWDLESQKRSAASFTDNAEISALITNPSGEDQPGSYMKLAVAGKLNLTEPKMRLAYLKNMKTDMPNMYGITPDFSPISATTVTYQFYNDGNMVAEMTADVGDLPTLYVDGFLEKVGATSTPSGTIILKRATSNGDPQTYNYNGTDYLADELRVSANAGGEIWMLGFGTYTKDISEYTLTQAIVENPEDNPNVAGCPDKQTKWYMNYYEVDFSLGTPFTNPLPPVTQPTSNDAGNVANGIHGPAGNLIFYTDWNPVNREYQIRNGAGVQFGTLEKVHPFSRELIILPYQCSNKQLYLIIYAFFNVNTDSNGLGYAIFDGEAQTVSQLHKVEDLGVSPVTPTFALNQGNSDGTYYLYANMSSAVKKYIIDLSVCDFFPDDLINVDSNNPVVFNGTYHSPELELSPDGSKLAWATLFGSSVTVVDLNAAGNLVSPTSFNNYNLPGSGGLADQVTGLEFNGTSDRLFINYNPFNALGGIRSVDLNSGVMAGTIPGTENYSRSQLEIASDCYLYAGNYFSNTDENKLARIDPSLEVFVTDYPLPNRLPFQATNGQYNDPEGIFTLPDFIDCESDLCQPPSCPGNLVVNAGFTDGMFPGDLNTGGTATSWGNVGGSSPQVNLGDGCEEVGCMQMWGNQVVGEGIEQSVTFMKDKSYEITFCGKWLDLVRDSARIRFRATNGTTVIGATPPNHGHCPSGTCDEIGISPVLDLNWNTYTLPTWTAPADFDNLVITVWNESNIDDGNEISWARIDDFCIVEKQTPPDTCTANFTFTTDDCSLNTVFTNTSTSSAGSPTYLWNFNDGSGNTSTDESPTYTFSAAGSYPVCLTITDGNCSNTFCDDVAVTGDTQDPTITCVQSLAPFPTNPGLCTAEVTTEYSADDNCMFTVECTRGRELCSSDPFPKGETIVTYTATDASGNTASCDILIRVEDQEPPQVSCISGLVLQLDAQCMATLSPEDIEQNPAIDNCEITAKVIDIDSFDGKDACNDVEVTLTVTDCGDNNTSCVTIVTLMEFENPVITCPADITIDSRDDPFDTGITGLPTATDNCDLNVDFSQNEVMEENCPNGVDVFTRTWTATDDCNNSTSCVQTITRNCDFSCDNNLASNGDFTSGLTSWNDFLSSSPQFNGADGCSRNGSVSMWGNQVVGEGIEQPMTFIAGQPYKIDFCAKWLNTVRGNAQVRFRATTGVGVVNYNNCPTGDCEEIGMSPILDLNWQSFTTACWVPTQNYSNLVVSVWSDSNVDDGNSISWLRVDDICVLPADCQPFDCPDNIVQNPGFEMGMLNGDLKNDGDSDFWEPIPGASPQVSTSQGCFEPGSITMWGNQVVGEGFRQVVSFKKGKSYQLKFCGKWVDSVKDSVSIRFRATNDVNAISQSNYNICSGNCEDIGTSPVLDLNWNTYELDCWSPSQDYDNLVVTIWNNFDVDDGALVSWARIDDICIVEKTIVDSCDALFTHAQVDKDPGLFCGTVDFTDASFSTTAITSWNWTFGDGNTSNLQNPTHTYMLSGTYPVTLTITSATGCESTYSENITVNFQDDIGINCRAPFTVNTDLGLCSADVGAPSADPVLNFCLPPPTITCTRSDNPTNLSDPYPVGVTTIGCTADYGGGRTVGCIYTVTVVDNEAPTVICPANINVQGTPGTTVSVTLPAPIGNDNCSATFTSSHDTGMFPCGTTVVTHTADDGSNPPVSCTFDINVRCPCPPCPNNVLTNADFQTPGGPFAQNWTPIQNSGSNTPDYVTNDGCGDQTSVQMWGNRDVGEAIAQNVNFVQGATYSISFCGRFENSRPTPAQFGFTAANGLVNPFPAGATTGYNIGSANTNGNTNWICYTISDWVAPQNFNTLIINVFNQNVDNNDATNVSWGRIDNICVDSIAGPPSDCCQNQDEFIDRVDSGFSWSTDDCKLTVTPNSLNMCDSVRWNWDDGNTEGWFGGSDPVMHTYQNSGNYNICMLVSEWDNTISPPRICNEREFCDSVFVDCPIVCECDKFTDLNINHPDFGNQQVKCGDPIFDLPCYESANGSLAVSGQLLCTGTDCPSEIKWEIFGPNGFVQVGSGSITGAGNFEVTLPQDLDCGSYTVNIIGECGDQTCRCNIVFRIGDDCCQNCDCGDFSDVTITTNGSSFDIACDDPDPFIAACESDISFRGDFDCNGCEASEITAELVTPSGTILPLPTAVAIGSPSLYKGTISANSITQPGTYRLIITGICDGKKCTCEIEFTVRACSKDCTCPIDALFVGNDITIGKKWNACRYSFNHPALDPICDEARWEVINSGNIIASGTTINGQSFTANLTDGVGYVVYLTVVRTDQNGDICETTVWKKFIAKCGTPPDVFDCTDEKALTNPSFDGRDGWTVISGESDLIFKPDLSYDMIGGSALLSGNRLRNDIIEQTFGLALTEGNQLFSMYAIVLDTTEPCPECGKIIAIEIKDPSTGGFIIIGEILLEDAPRNEWFLIQQEILQDFEAIRLSVKNPYGDPDFETKVAVDALCIQEMPKTCCIDQETFSDEVKNVGFTPEILVNDSCTITVITDLSDDCYLVDWDWGDGSQTTGQSTNINVSHMYAVEGTYEICMTVSESNSSGVCWSETVCDTVTVTRDNNCIPSGTNEFFFTNQISLFPNPTGGDVFIQRIGAINESLSIRAFDLTGREISNSLMRKGEGKGVINLSGFAQGLYIIEVRDEVGGVGYKRIVKQ